MIERLLLGEAALARGEVDAAELLFNQVAAADPRNAIALVGLARVAVHRGDRDGARALAGRALEIDPDEAAATRLLTDLDVPPDEPPRVVEPAPHHEPARLAEPEPVPRPIPPRSGWRGLLDRLLRRG